MYTAIILALLAGGLALAYAGLRTGRLWLVMTGAAVWPATFLFFALLGLWGEMLWFEALGYQGRFWTAIGARVGFAAAGAAAGALGVYLLTLPIPREAVLARFWPELVGGILGLLWGLNHWEAGLLFLYAVEAGVSDPILGKDVGFYMFVLPFYDALFRLLLEVAGVALAAALVAFRAPAGVPGLSPFEDVPPEEEEPLPRRPRGRRRGRQGWDLPPAEAAAAYRPLYLALGAAGLVLAWGFFLGRYHLMYSTSGAVRGAGWTDVHVRLPAYWLMTGLTGLLGLALVVFGLSGPAYAWFRRRAALSAGDVNPAAAGLLAPVVGVAATGLLALLVVPGLVQWLAVTPNEITRERPYITHAIAFTRLGFDLGKVEESEFPVAEALTQQTLEENRHLLEQVRLWDPSALMAVYRQFQEIRLYYQFHDVDIDRYVINGAYRQVMVSAREMVPDNLPEGSQTFVNRRFKYTHGFGLTLAPVSEFTPDGLPDLLVKDIPPVPKYASLEVEQPRVYYGELTDGYVVVNTSEEEFDYPHGDQNVYNRYDGTGGVELSSLWRKFLFGWKFDGTRFFISGYPTRRSRVMFHRQVRQRVRTLAPFLHFDADPYVVLDRGRMFWIIDGYTTSDYFPYSEPFFSGETIQVEQGGGVRSVQSGVAEYLHGVNYIRNSVKAVVDAYHGSVDFYVFDPDDPVVRVWRKIYPGLFKDRGQMPESLQAHARYPEGYLLAQGMVYSKYHMTDPEVFYNQEDLWVRATEKYYDEVRPVAPYYVMWQPPGTDSVEFILMMPFTPKNRQVLIGWVAGMCDGANYGRLLAYRFPKDKRVLGTQQVDTKIDQDRYLAAQLTLWNQRGSRVIRGNVLVIPIGQTLLYVEPIYLQAEAAAYPELRLVAVMHGDKLSYAETFDAALEGLFKEGGPVPPPDITPGAVSGTVRELSRRASRAFENYLRLQGEGKFQDAARELQTLRETLRELERSAEGEPAPGPKIPPP